jgi:hypothetical protein
MENKLQLTPKGFLKLLRTIGLTLAADGTILTAPVVSYLF